MKNNQLVLLRKKIDKVDNQLVTLLAKRMRIVNQIKKAKNKGKLPIADKKREVQILRKAKGKAKKLGLRGNFIEKLLKLIIRESKRIQK